MRYCLLLLKSLILVMAILATRFHHHQFKVLIRQRRFFHHLLAPTEIQNSEKRSEFLKHIQATKEESLSNAIQRDSKLSLEFVNYLIAMGAVYVQSTNDIKFIRYMNDKLIQPGDNIRYHPSPKRYNTSAVDWASRIIVKDPNFIVIDKPFGIPVSGTVDNYHENVCRGLGNYLRRNDIFNVHRLDVDTSGLLVLGFGSEAVGLINELFRHRKIAKTYRMMVTTTTEVGQERGHNSMAFIEANKTLVHFMKPSTYAPRIFVNPSEATTGDFECRSRIISRSPVVSKSKQDWRSWLTRFNNTKVNDKSKQWFQAGFTHWLDNAAGSEDTIVSFCEVDLDLQTGRTHQCRGQINALGNGLHIAGDGMYCGGPVYSVTSPTKKRTKKDDSSKNTENNNNIQNIDEEIEDDDSENDSDDSIDPTSRYLALQASKIEFLNYFSDDDSRKFIADVERQVMPYKPAGHVFEPSKSVIRKARGMMLSKVNTKWEKYIQHKQSLAEGQDLSTAEVAEIHDSVLKFVVNAEIPSTWWQQLSGYLHQHKK